MLQKQLELLVREAALNVELDDHLSYSKHCKSSSNNSHNGTSTKTIIANDG